MWIHSHALSSYMSNPAGAKNKHQKKGWLTWFRKETPPSATRGVLTFETEPPVKTGGSTDLCSQRYINGYSIIGDGFNNSQECNSFEGYGIQEESRPGATGSR